MQGNTLLHYASCIQDYRSVYVENKCWRKRLHAETLQWIIDSKPAIQLLLQGGADLRAKNSEGMTPLIYALKHGQHNKTNIKTLIRYSKPQEINEADDNACTALHHLSMMKKSENGFLTDITKVRLKYVIILLLKIL